ncbi:hypothetical protein FIU94_07135 [Sulfitobacter sp. THAF37]|uniref:hypothetical protein n=1 Tax=Sulfitobacter sp. THAF37 TaxID=2587855 RepID=UPI0012679C0D|nr:hypothetical protein [Sulfitobacter sp. THAF37]QFT58601.1 hypothetical protein FIU94_07135 [Sulfitobacter sp. THAF37]
MAMPLRRNLTYLLIVLAWLLAVLATPSRATPEPGLMWNRSGLPAVFPLQLRTHPGLDYLLMLTPVNEDAAVLAAYARGGEFFRVLVPPGEFEVSIAAGREWQGEKRLFGPDTRFFNLEAPLTFRVKGLSRRQGHVIDLRRVLEDPEAIETASRSLCQTLRLAPDERWLAVPGPDPDGPDDRIPRYEVRPRLC